MKKLAFFTEGRFIKDSNGLIFSEASFDNTLWMKYLSSFSEIIVFARVINIDGYIGDNDFISNIKNVSFIEIPYYIGAKQYFLNYLNIKSVILSGIISNKDCVFVLRVPGLIGSIASQYLNKLNIPYAAEVVGDPEDVFSRGSFNHPLRKLFQYITVNQLKRTVGNAKAVLYVTKFTLQSKYKAPKNAYQVYASDVILPDNEIMIDYKKWQLKKEYSIISIGSLAQLYKAPDILLKSIDYINKKYEHINVKLTWLGDGVYKDKMLSLASDLGILDQIFFLGNVSRDQVFKYLENSDIFVLASRTEGLPRVIVEAMGKGIPIVGTSVGGIPELLHCDVLVPKDDFIALAEMIVRLISDENFYNSQAERNLKESGVFKNSELSIKRNEFYKNISNSFFSEGGL